MADLSLPENANITGIVLAIRHAKAIPQSEDMPNAERPLSPEGIEMCHELRPSFSRLVDHLGGIFPTENPRLSYHCSKYARTIRTQDILFPDTDCMAWQTLNWIATTRQHTKEELAWFKKWKKDNGLVGKPRNVVNRYLAPEIRYNDRLPAWRVVSDNYERFMVSQYFLNVIVVHGPALSVTACGHIDDNQLGVSECEGYVFFVSPFKILKATRILIDDIKGF